MRLMTSCIAILTFFFASRYALSSLGNADTEYGRCCKYKRGNPLV